MYFGRVYTITGQACLPDDYIADFVNTRLSYQYQDQLAAAEASAKLAGCCYLCGFAEMRQLLIDWERLWAMELQPPIDLKTDDCHKYRCWDDRCDDNRRWEDSKCNYRKNDYKTYDLRSDCDKN